MQQAYIDRSRRHDSRRLQALRIAAAIAILAVTVVKSAVADEVADNSLSQHPLQSLDIAADFESALSDRDVRKRYPATRRILASAEKAVPFIVEQLGSQDFKRRKLALILARDIHDPRILEAALALKSDSSFVIRMHIIGVLTQFDGTATIKGLKSMFLEDSDERIKSAALNWYAVKAGEAASPLLISALEHKSPRIRLTAAKRLGKLGDRRGLSIATQNLKNMDEELRRAAFDALLWIADSQSVPLLREIISNKDTDSGDRLYAQRNIMRIEFLGLDPSDQIGYLRNALGHEWIIRYWAFHELENTEEARALLKEIASDENHVAMGEALEVLGSWDADK